MPWTGELKGCAHVSRRSRSAQSSPVTWQLGLGMHNFRAMVSAGDSKSQQKTESFKWFCGWGLLKPLPTTISKGKLFRSGSGRQSDKQKVFVKKPVLPVKAFTLTRWEKRMFSGQVGNAYVGKVGSPVTKGKKSTSGKRKDFRGSPVKVTERFRRNVLRRLQDYKPPKILLDHPNCWAILSNSLNHRGCKGTRDWWARHSVFGAANRARRERSRERRDAHHDLNKYSCMIGCYYPTVPHEKPACFARHREVNAPKAKTQEPPVIVTVDSGSSQQQSQSSVIDESDPEVILYRLIYGHD